MDRKEIEKYILNEFAGEELMNGDESYITLKGLVDLRDVSDFFLDKILPEVLKGVDTMEIDVEISLLDTMNDDFKRGFNSCWGAIKKSLSKKYNITL